MAKAPPLGATAMTAASGGSRESLLGQRPAGCKRQRSRRREPQPGLGAKRLRGLHHQTPQRRRDEPISIPAPPGGMIFLHTLQKKRPRPILSGLGLFPVSFIGRTNRRVCRCLLSTAPYLSADKSAASPAVYGIHGSRYNCLLSCGLGSFAAMRQALAAHQRPPAADPCYSAASCRFYNPF